MKSIRLHSQNRLMLERIQTLTVSLQPRLGLATDGCVCGWDGSREQSFQWIGREPKHLVEVLVKLFKDKGRVKINANHTSKEPSCPGTLIDYILQERMNFESVIQNPFGMTKAEIRIMYYLWDEKCLPVLTIIRMGRGVGHNKEMQWVGSSAGLFRA